MSYLPLHLSADNIFPDHRHYVDPVRLYMSYYHNVPSMMQSNHVDIDKVQSYIEKELAGRIIARNQREVATAKKKLVRHVKIYVLDSPVIILLETDHFVQLVYQADQEVFARGLLTKLMEFRKRKNEKTTTISMVITGLGGLDTTDLFIPKPKLSFDLNYNADLKPTHDTIMDFIRKKQQSGLVLLHGDPGTGKSTYIRYLIRSIHKKVIFLPPGLASTLDAPAFTSFLIENANTVFVIEDAEELITSRDSGRNSSISMILNLTDGLLGESLGIQIIATFNTDLRRIDNALLRKGRLVALYEFRKLEKARAEALLASIGHVNPVVEKPLSLAEIYNTDQADLLINQPRAQIGFLANAV